MSPTQPAHCAAPDRMRPLARPGSDGEAGVPAVPGGSGFVVEPYSALGEVTETQHAADRDGHSGAAGAVRPPLERMGEGVPVVEITHHRHSSGRLIGRQCKGDADGAATPGLACLDQLLSPLWRAATQIGSAVPLLLVPTPIAC